MAEGDKEWEKLAEQYLNIASEDPSKLQNMTAICNLCLFIIDNSFAKDTRGGGDVFRELRITKRDGSDPDKTIVIEPVKGNGLHVRVHDVKKPENCDSKEVNPKRITDEFVTLFKELGW